MAPLRNPVGQPVDGAPVEGRSPVSSLGDRLAFRRAEAVLTGLTGCRQGDAARSLHSAAAQLDRAVPDVARLFLDALERPAEEHTVLLLLLLARDIARPRMAAPGAVGSAEDDGLTAVTFRAGGAAAAEASAVVDLSGLGSMDAAGVRAVVATARQAFAAGADVRVVPPHTAEGQRLLAFAVRLQLLPPADGHGPRPADQPAVITLDGLDALNALDALYDRCAGACLTLARRVLGDDGRAETAVLGAFLDVWHHISAGDEPPAPIDRWLQRLTHERAVAVLRAERTRLPARPAPPAGRDRLRGLPVDQQRAVQWAVWGGCTVQDIAVLTGVPLREVRATLVAGMSALARAREVQPGGRQTRHPR